MAVNKLKDKQIYLHNQVQFVFMLWTVAGYIQPNDESVALLHKSSERKLLIRGVESTVPVYLEHFFFNQLEVKPKLNTCLCMCESYLQDFLVVLRPGLWSWSLKELWVESELVKLY
jgi:hypothetical protein